MRHEQQSTRKAIFCHAWRTRVCLVHQAPVRVHSSLLARVRMPRVLRCPKTSHHPGHVWLTYVVLCKMRVRVSRVRVVGDVHALCVEREERVLSVCAE